MTYDRRKAAVLPTSDELLTKAEAVTNQAIKEIRAEGYRTTPLLAQKISWILFKDLKQRNRHT